MRSINLIVGISILFCLLSFTVHADQVILTGDKIFEGKILSDTAESVEIQTNDYGKLSFPKKGVAKIVYSEKSPAATPTPGHSPSSATAVRPIAATPEIMAGYDAVVFGVVKDVFIKYGNANWTPAAENMQLKIKDELRTGLGKAKLKLRGRGELRLPPNSEMVLLSVDSQGEKVSIELKGGRIWNSITPGGGVVNYTVKTPDLVAGVRGTLFKVSMDEGAKARVAVFEGSVYTAPASGGPEITVPMDQSISIDASGHLTGLQAVNPEEIKEWTEWDAWALDIHQNISSRFMYGGQQIDAMAKVVAEDGKKYEQITNEANRTILTNKEADRLDQFKNAFLRFAEDTGVQPSTELAFSALIENPGLPGWKGPYIPDKTLPLLDRWGTPIRYFLKKSAASGNTFGEIISSGPDKMDNEGKPNSDDLRVIIPYRQPNQ